MSILDDAMTALAPIAYVNKPINEEWVNDGAEFYDSLPVEFTSKLAIIIPQDMSVDFLLGITHAADSSSVGARCCWIIKSRGLQAEFVEKLNNLVDRIQKGGM